MNHITQTDGRFVMNFDRNVISSSRFTLEADLLAFEAQLRDAAALAAGIHRHVQMEVNVHFGAETARAREPQPASKITTKQRNKTKDIQSNSTLSDKFPTSSLHPSTPPLKMQHPIAMPSLTVLLLL